MAPRTRGIELGTTAPQLFLSHSSEDDPIVKRLAENLNTCGVDVWLDAWELRVGDDLHERIADAVDKSKFVAVLVSRHFSGSKWIKGEVHQALAREKAEGRNIVLPLLIQGATNPPVLASKKFLSLADEDYFTSLAQLAGLVHDLPTKSVDDGISKYQPGSVMDCMNVLRFSGYEPFCVLDSRTLIEIEQFGGDRKGNKIYFSPIEILENPDISLSLRNLMERLSVEWG